MNLFKSRLGKIYYEVKGEGKKVLLLLHGNTFSSEIFNTYLKHFTGNYRVILPDLPGHGKSEKIEEFPPDFYMQCSEIFILLLKELKVKKADVIGIRGGGIIAMNMGIKAPGLMDKIVADSFPGKKISNGNLDLIIDEMNRRKKNIFNRMRWKRYHDKDWRNIIEADLRLMEKMKYSDYRVVVPDIANIKNDVLLIGSARDDLVPPLVPIYNKLKKKYPHFEVVLFEAGKNPSLISNKKKWLREVCLFLDCLE